MFKKDETKRFKTVAQIFFMLLPITIVLLRSDPSQIFQLYSSFPISFIPSLIVILLIRIFLQSFRFYMLLSPFKAGVGLWKIFFTDLKSKYYSLVLPSSVGQDIVRGAYLRGEIPGGDILGITLFFRVTGIFPLVVLSFIGLLFPGSSIDLFADLLIPLFVVVVGFTAISLLLFSKRLSRFFLRPLKRCFPSSAQPFMANSLRAFQLYRSHPFLIMNNFIVSFITQLAIVLFSLTALYGITGELYLRETLLVIPLIEIISIMVPFAPNGAGAREALYLLFFSYLGRSSEEAFLFIAVSASLYVVNLFGGLVVLSDKLSELRSRRVL